MFWKKKKKDEYYDVLLPCAQTVLRCRRRAGLIQDIANSYLRKVPFKAAHEDFPIVVKYSDLLRIWDKANLINDDL